MTCPLLGCPMGGTCKKSVIGVITRFLLPPCRRFYLSLKSQSPYFLRYPLDFMALVHCIAATIPPEAIIINPARISIPRVSAPSSSIWNNARNLSLLSQPFSRCAHQAKAKLPESEAISAADAFTQFKHVLLPITDKNPYLSEGTRQATATVASLAKKYEADITVVVIDEEPKESVPEHDKKLSSVRWHLSEGGFQEFRLIERLGEGKKPTAIISEVADDLNLDLVVISMEAIHSKHIDANLLAEFSPCPVLLLPL